MTRWPRLHRDVTTSTDQWKCQIQKSFQLSTCLPPTPYSSHVTFTVQTVRGGRISISQWQSQEAVGIFCWLWYLPLKPQMMEVCRHKHSKLQESTDVIRSHLKRQVMQFVYEIHKWKWWWVGWAIVGVGGEFTSLVNETAYYFTHEFVISCGQTFSHSSCLTTLGIHFIHC